MTLTDKMWLMAISKFIICFKKVVVLTKIVSKKHGNITIIVCNYKCNYLM